MEINDEYILTKYIDKSGVCQGQHFKRASSEEIKYLQNRFSDVLEDTELKEIVYRIKYNIEEKPKCPYCGKPVKLKDMLHGILHVTCGSYDCDKLAPGVRHPKGHPQSESYRKLREERFAKTSEVLEDHSTIILPDYINDSYIIAKFVKKNGVLNSARLREQLTDEEKAYLYFRFKEYHGWTYSNNIKRILWKIEDSDIPICPICRKHTVRLFFKNKENVFGQTCENNRCIRTNQKNHVDVTNIKLYGHTCVLASEYGIAKSKATKLERYNDPYYTNVEKTKISLAAYWDSVHSSYEFLSSHPTYFDPKPNYKPIMLAYGYTNVFQIPEVIEKIQQTKLERHGDPNWNNQKKNKATKLERYNDENYNNQEKSMQTCYALYGTYFYFQSDDFSEKSKLTCQARYGCDYWTQSEKFKKFISEFMSSPEMVKYRREYMSRITEKTITSSKEELFVYSALTRKFPNTIHQYRDIRYSDPETNRQYFCDFYIPDLDMFIEYQGSQYHHGHPFDENNLDDVSELNRLISKVEEYKLSHPDKLPQASGIINTWCYSDIIKRNIAKQNNLNYIELWNIKEAEKFVESL